MNGKDDVGVYMKMRGPEAVEGLVVTVIEGKGHAVLVNVVGDIRPEKLQVLGERFNLEAPQAPARENGETRECEVMLPI
jgi:hypothetical protein